jgi:tRNA pseudouridine55 synthase
MNAVLIIDKPAGLTSHDVVHRVRRIVGQRAVGHLGTLDPMATGVLPLVLGSFTRLAQFYLSSEKTYEGGIRFGFATDTYDADGEHTTAEQVPAFSLDELRSMAERFKGPISQMPPPFSAKKIKGVPAYKLARKKKDFALKPLQVEVREFEILALENGCAAFRARVGSGTYLRSIAHDLGQVAGCGAHLQSLRRTAVAEFTIGGAHTLAELEQVFNSGEVADTDKVSSVRAASANLSCIDHLLVHPRELIPSLPTVSVSVEVASGIRHGQAVNLPDFSQAPEVKVFYGQRDLIAIVTRVAGTLFQPKIVLA